MKLTLRLSAIFGSLLLGGALLGTPIPKVEANQIPDQEIADAIEDKYLFDGMIDLNRIDTTVIEGIVELTGTVNNLLAKERATYIAEQIKGVRAVSNRIDVKPSERRSDSALTDAVNDALFHDPAADSYEVRVSVQDGVATLSGTVESFAEKRLTERVAKGVRGVTGINNEIQIEYETDRPDAEIKPEIEHRLQWDALVNDGLIDVSVNGGTVALNGVVGSAAEKRRARYAAWVTGVKAVDASGLEVEWWAEDDDLRQNKYVAKEDAEIEQAIEDAALYDPRVLAARIEPEVENGWVTLRGEVRSLRAKRAAGELARNTVGTMGVSNRLKVRPIDMPTDAEIKENINTALYENPITDSYQINVDVYDGNVTLTGRVDNSAQKSQAELIAERVRGVSRVKNYLDVSEGESPWTAGYYYPWYKPTITPRDMMTDPKIEERIENELWWSPFVDSDQVEVHVQDGVATLTGEVDSWEESQAAMDNAYEGGADQVVNLLSIG